MTADHDCQVDDAVRVSGFVVVPGQDFDHVIDHISGRGIDNRRKGRSVEVTGNQGQIAVVEKPGERGLRRQFERVVDVRFGYAGLFNGCDEIDQRNVRCGYPDGKPVEFARQLNIETVAEFVDSREILDKVTELGIDYSQGYFLGKPESKLTL